MCLVIRVSFGFTLKQMGEQLSRALEAKMTEIMGEIELRLRPPDSDHDQSSFEPSFDNRVDSAISTLEVFSLSRLGRALRTVTSDK